MLPDLLSMIQNSIQSIQNFEYMEFLADFMITYSQILDDQVVVICNCLVQRITFQLSLQVNPLGEQSEMFIQKCLNILKQVTQNKALMQKYSSQYEQAYIPIFEYMVDPSKISFEDDILIILKNFIKKTGVVSDIILKVFPCMEKVFIKNKCTFGDALMDSLNYYMIYGRDRIMQEKACLEMLIKIADQAMFCVEPNVTINNSEGAIFLQIIFQIF